MIQMLKTKIQELVVTDSSIDYPGSIALPGDILSAAGIYPFEKVYVNNKSNGNRIITYAVVSSEQKVTVNGAASHLFRKGDLVHVLSYALVNEEEAKVHQPLLVLANGNNSLLEVKPYILNRV